MVESNTTSQNKKKNNVVPNDTLLDSKTSAFFIRYLRSFLLQEVGTNIEIYNQTLFTEGESLEH